LAVDPKKIVIAAEAALPCHALHRLSQFDAERLKYVRPADECLFRA